MAFYLKKVIIVRAYINDGTNITSLVRNYSCKWIQINTHRNAELRTIESYFMWTIFYFSPLFWASFGRSLVRFSWPFSPFIVPVGQVFHRSETANVFYGNECNKYARSDRTTNTNDSNELRPRIFPYCFNWFFFWFIFFLFQHFSNVFLIPFSSLAFQRLIYIWLWFLSHFFLHRFRSQVYIMR